MFHFRRSEYPVFVHPLGHRIWQVTADTVTGMLAVQLRDHTREQAWAVMLTPDTPETPRREIRSEYGWFSGIEVFHDGVMLAHGFVQPDSPEHLGVAAFTPEAGSARWHERELAFKGLLDEGVVLAPPGPLVRHGVVTDLETGKVLREAELRAPALVKGMEAFRARQLAGMGFPEAVPKEGPDYGRLRETLGIHPFLDIARHRTGPYEIVAWHEGKPAEGFDHGLAVLKDGAPELQGWLERGMEKMNPSPFFLLGRSLISIHQMTDLVVTRLP